MSKGLEALENICNQCEYYQFEKSLRPKKCPFNKNCVFKERIKKELKALTIIKRDYDAGDLYYDDESNTYWYLGLEVTKEEYDLLWEVFTND